MTDFAFSAWIIWYGLKIGLTYERVVYSPIGEILDLIAIEQIENGQVLYKRTMTREEEEADFWRQMNYT